MKTRVVRRLPAVFAVAFVVFVIVGAYVLGSVIERQQEFAAELERRNELRAHLLCEANNETRHVLELVLDALAAPRDDDLPGEFEERRRLRESVDEFVQPQPCPPPPKE